MRVALALLATTLVACDSTVDSLGYDLPGNGIWGDAAPATTLNPLIGPASYPNAFRDVLGKSDADIANKIAGVFAQLFHGTSDESIYVPVGDDKAYIYDVYHGDIRTEGIGYGMMICVELDKRDEFDKLWTYAKTTARYPSGPNQGYFASSCDTPTGAAPCVDPFGLEQFVMALVFAHDRWQIGASDASDASPVDASVSDDRRVNDGTVSDGRMNEGGANDGRTSESGTNDGAVNGGAVNDGGANDGGANEAGVPVASNEAGLYKSTIDYGADALELFDVMRRKEQENGGIVEGVTNTFDASTKLVFDVPNVSASTYTRPSVEMPAYYDLWAQATDDPFYATAAASARAYWEKAANATTGLMPVRAYFADGAPVPGSDAFQSEGYRAELNVALDRIWFAREPWEVDEADRLLAFFTAQGIALYGASYTLDGTVIDPSREGALVVANGVTALIATSANRAAFIDAVWNNVVPTGLVRYYPGILDLVSLLILSGQYRVY